MQYMDPQSNSPAAQREQCFNIFCDINDWSQPLFEQVAQDIMQPQIGPAPIHRKVWEFAIVTLALQRLGLWHDSSVGLSVAGGTERFLF